MHVEKISIGRGKKLSVNYNSYDYHVSVSVELEDGDTTEALRIRTRKQELRDLPPITQARLDTITGSRKNVKNKLLDLAALAVPELED